MKITIVAIKRIKNWFEKSLAVAELELGMYVVELDRPWLETPFALQGFLVSSREEIDQLQEYCDYVFIDVTQTTFQHREKRKIVLL